MTTSSWLALFAQTADVTAERSSGFSQSPSTSTPSRTRSAWISREYARESLRVGWLLKGATGADNEGDATGALCDGLE